MPSPSGYALASPRDVSPYSSVPVSEHAIDEDGRVLGPVPLVRPARKLSQAAVLFLACIALALVLLISRPFIHISSRGEDLEHGQAEPLQLMDDRDGEDLGYGQTEPLQLGDRDKGEDLEHPGAWADSAFAAETISVSTTSGNTTTTTTTTTRWYPNVDWLKWDFEKRYTDLCATREELVAPMVSKPALGGEEVMLKVLTYNLHWWQLFEAWHGKGGSAGKLVAASNALGYFDILAFQECGDEDRVMKDAGLLKYYETFAAPYQKCVAYRKDAWDFLDEGHVNITHDVHWNNWGMRGAQYLRLRHNKTGHTVFFVNYHGGLSVNAGGVCGGKAAARNILNMINSRSHYDDKVILVGDFNSNPASHLVRELRTSLLHVYSGTVLGGIDNILTNLPASSVVGNYNLGTGGSDHDALSTVFNLAAQEEVTDSQKSRQLQYGALQRLQSGPPVYDWQWFWCGVTETDVEYIVSDDISIWSEVKINLSTADWCCRECQQEKQCRAWMFHGVAGQKNATRCVMSSAVVESKVNNMGVVSGLPFQTVVADMKASLDSTPSP